jgi:hypothetical protein
VGLDNVKVFNIADKCKTPSHLDLCPAIKHNKFVLIGRFSLSFISQI